MEKLIEYCEKHSIEYDICGKLIVATEERELIELDKLYHRGIENELKIELINQAEMKEIEPNVNGISAIKVPMAASRKRKMKLRLSQIRGYFIQNNSLIVQDFLVIGLQRWLE